MKWDDGITDALGTKYPIVQAAMLGVSTPEMAASVSDSGGLGSLPVGGLSPQKTSELIRKTKELTTRPFAVNLFLHKIPKSDLDETERMQTFLQKLCSEYGIEFEKQDVRNLEHYSYKEQIEILVREKIPVVSFTFGILDEESIEILKKNRTILIGTATSVKEAILLEEKQIDMITAQGIEAGGHRGSFLEGEALPQVGLISLVPRIVEQTKIPVLAAGGIHNGKTIRAALAMGAKGVQIGSAFLASHESKAIPSYKKAIQNSSETDSVLTRSFSGRWARGIRNTFLTEVERSGLVIPDYPIQNSLTTKLRAFAQQADNHEFTNLWAGQSASKAESKSTREIFLRLVQELETK